MTGPKPFLSVGTPAFGGMLSGLYLSSMLKLQLACRQRGMPFQVILQQGDALIPRARQEITARFLEQDKSTHLLFVDADIGFEPEQVFRLLDFGADCCAAVYPHKWMNPERLKALAREGKGRPDSAALTYVCETEAPEKAAERNGFVRVRYAGTGFLMLSRKMLVSMTGRYPELRYSGSFTSDDRSRESQFRYALFNCMIDPKTGEYLSEDYSFCRRWLEMGGEIWADKNSRLSHMGASAVSGDFSTQFPG
ncbi:MAG TPA: hypothetical protein VMV05_01065 [bacterium]|nr:hypothetical protein [bacterium]